VRPWYRTKLDPSFQDMLSALRRAVADLNILDPAETRV
jgi:hypothetical protein